MVTHQQAVERTSAGFWIHLACYIIVVSGLAILNYQRNPDNLWVLWVAGGWGIGNKCCESYPIPPLKLALLGSENRNVEPLLSAFTVHPPQHWPRS